MSAIYDKDTNTVYVSVNDLVEFISGGGDIGAKDQRGNKNGKSTAFF